jgi:hypothetical protein
MIRCKFLSCQMQFEGFLSRTVRRHRNASPFRAWTFSPPAQFLAIVSHAVLNTLHP